MNDFYKQDIFFFITTIAVILLAIFLSVVLIYLARILKDIKYISRKARVEADIVTEELSELRENIKDQGSKLKFFASFFNNIYKKSKKMR